MLTYGSYKIIGCVVSREAEPMEFRDSLWQARNASKSDVKTCFRVVLNLNTNCFCNPAYFGEEIFVFLNGRINFVYAY